MFLIDIYMNFNTGIVLPDMTTDYNRKRVTFAYLKSWFTVDILASVPVNFIMDQVANHESNVNVSG